MDMGEKEGVNGGRLIDHDVAMEYCAYDEEIFVEVLEMYCDSWEEKKNALKKAMADNDWNTYTVEMHSLKSTSLNIGCTALYDEALALEKASKSGDLDYIKEKHEGCMHLYDKVVKEGKDYVSGVF